MKALMRGGRADTGTEESAEDASVNGERSALSPAAELPAASNDDMHARRLRAIETKRAELLRKAEEGGGASERDLAARPSAGRKKIPAHLPAVRRAFFVISGCVTTAPRGASGGP